MRVNSENEEKASVSSAGFAAQRAVSTLVIRALFFVNDGNMPASISVISVIPVLAFSF